MQITKYLHSCVLIKTEGQVILIDPGQFTFEAEVLTPDKLPQLDFIVITHEHADHFYLPFIKALVRAFPEVMIISTQNVVNTLKEKGIPAVTTSKTEFITLEHASHEVILFTPPPENLQVTIGGIFTHPGDSHHFTTKAQILAMPMTAPWGSMIQAMEVLITLKPKTVIPIHDWHWKEEALMGMYPRVAAFLKEHGITFIIPQTGNELELEG